MPKGVYPRKPGQRRTVKIRSAPINRLLNKVAVNADGCWMWQGAKSSAGYGKLSRGRKGEGLVLAHRLAYELLVGPIPKGQTLDHLCRNRACILPNHLEVTSMRENIRRGAGISAKNTAKTHCPQEHRYDQENTYYDPLDNRHCRVCGKMRARGYRRAKQKEGIAIDQRKNGGSG